MRSWDAWRRDSECIVPELTGRDEQGRPLQDCHRHAHILPVDLDGDGHLDHLIVHAPMGLGEAAQRAIRTLRRTWTKGGVGELQLALAGSGSLDVLRSLPTPLDSRIEQLLGPPHGARVWVSTTPFVPPRFLKRRGANTLRGQINAELASRGFPPVERLDELPRNSEILCPATLRASTTAGRRRRRSMSVMHFDCNSPSRSTAHSRSATPRTSGWGCSMQPNRTRGEPRGEDRAGTANDLKQLSNVHSKCHCTAPHGSPLIVFIPFIPSSCRLVSHGASHR